MSDNLKRCRIEPTALRVAEAETRRLARSHYENFLVATVLLPRRLRQPFYNVYAFCRTADDLADELDSPDESLRQLDRLGGQLEATYAGNPEGNLLIALANTISRFDLPQQPFDDLLDAFRQDQSKTRYANQTELLDYCRRSANPVGRIVLRLCGCFGDRRAELSDKICTGLQLANFWQDVARDYAKGRIYLPAETMDQFQVDESMFSQSPTPAPLRQALAYQCDLAEALFRDGSKLVQLVPHWFAGDVKLFIGGGMATLAAIRKIDFDVITKRPVVGRGRQFWMLAKAMMGL